MGVNETRDKRGVTGGNGMKTRLAILLGAASAGALATAAAAQPVTPNGAAASHEIQEVIVTAQRRVERLQDVPIAVTVATGEQLETAGITRLEDISLIAPGVQI